MVTDLHNPGIGRKFDVTHVIEVPDGAGLTVRSRQSRGGTYKGPVVIVCDHPYWDAPNRVVRCGTIRAEIWHDPADCWQQSATIAEHYRKPLRRRLRDMPVFDTGAPGRPFSEPDKSGVYQYYAQGGFYPILPVGWIAVDVLSMAFPGTWCVMHESNPRLLRDREGL